MKGEGEDLTQELEAKILADIEKAKYAKPPQPRPPVYPAEVLRRERGLSQNGLGRLLGMTRSQIQGLLRKTWTQLGMGELKLLARCLDVRLIRLISRFDTGDEALQDRSHRTRPFFNISYRNGTRIDSFFKEHRPLFIGSLCINPGMVMVEAQVPPGDEVFCYVLQGELLVRIGDRESHVGRDEFFCLRRADVYEFHNPGLQKDTVALLVAVPSFLLPPAA